VIGVDVPQAAEAMVRVRLHTGTLPAHRVAWYGRHGHAIERIEALSDRSITHMINRLGHPLEPCSPCHASAPT
jgi:hypothetical protein